ncbi:MAG: CotH kinase family protein [Verrucomicrobiota bacterium]
MALLAGGAVLDGAGSGARAASYPATGTQNFTYANGVVTGSGSWNDGSALSGTTMGDPAVPVASAQASALRLTADGVFNSISSFKLPEIDPGQDVSSLTVTFSLKLKAAGTPGQGMSVSFGDIPADDGDGEFGFSLPRGLEVAWVTYVDTAEGATQGEIVVYANRVKVAGFPKTFTYDDTFRAVSVQWTAAGLNLTYDGTALATNLAVPGFVPGVGDRVAFSARTGAAVSQEIAIDTLRVVTTPAAVISTGGPVISEFVADNSNSYEDEDLEPSDWIEILNGGTAAVPMAGWYLTDDPALLTKWTLPAVTLNANAYRVIFASGKDRSPTTATGVLHTNFSLSKTSGYLALVRPDKTIASEYTYTAQQKDIPYGEVGASRTKGYLETPTPGAKNISVVADGPPAEEAVFSQGGGLLANATPVVLSIAAPAAPGAVVRYTTTQSLPTELSPVYSAPFNITATTTVRARVFEPGKLPGPVNSRTFLKLDPTLTNYNGSGQVFSSPLPVIIFDSFGVAVDGTTDPAAARPFRPTYAVTLAPDSATGRTRLDGPVDYRGRSGTHVRGESSSGFDQKSYAWETWTERDMDKDESILGLPAESDWVLHGPYSDKTMMRNHLIYSTFQNARGDWFAPRTKFVEVFFNQQANQPVSYSDYKGVYLLVEKIKRNSNRVNIAKLNPLVTAPLNAANPDQANVSGGYIFKKDKASLGSTGWSTNTGVPLQSSTPDTFPTAQLAAIRTYVNSFETALNGASYANPVTGYRAWIDVDTFIDWQLAVEMSKQIDGYVFSTYFNKDRNGKFRAGPLWDFNISLGNANYAEGEFSTGWDYDASRTGALAGQLWFPRLLSDPNYRVATFDRYWELRRGVWSTEAMMARIDAVSELLRDGNPANVTNATPLTAISPIARHFRRYPILGQAPWPNPASATTRTTFQAEIAHLKNWMTERLNWIDNQYGVLSTSARPPVMMRAEGGGGAAQITLAPFAGTVQGANFPTGQLYYTTDGSDPRPADYKMPTSTNVTILPEFGQGSWLVPTAVNGGTTQSIASWTGLADPPNAASWTTGTLGIGFETQATSASNPFKYYLSGNHAGDTAWNGGTSNLESAMLNVSSSAFLRVPFAITADQRARLARLQVKMRYDDGFIVYVNGVEAARQYVKADTVPAWNTVADAVPNTFTDALGATTGVTLDISNAIQNLQVGGNMLAILAVNKTTVDNDFLCSPSLLGGLAVKPTGTLPAITSTAYTAPFNVAATTTVKARLFAPDSGLWSALTTSTYVVGAQPASKSNLVISEINYAPLPPTPAEITAAGPAVQAADFEFVEFLNTSAEPVDLTNVRLGGAVDEFNFTQGITPAMILPPGGRVVLCGNSTAFHARYGNDPAVKVAGEFSGNLNNSGEAIVLTDKDGAPIWSFTYSNNSPWPVINDGKGSSILLNNPARHPAPDPTAGTNWRASPATNGAPGLADSVPFTGTPNADTDGDGTPDLLEYIFGSNAADASSTLGPKVVFTPGAAGTPGAIRLEIPRSSSAEGFDWKVETSADLVTWSGNGQTLTGSRRDSSGRVWEQWSVPLPAGASGQKMFYRLVATRP